MKEDLRFFKFSFSEINLSLNNIEKFMGYEPGTAPEPIPEMIRDVLKQAADYCDIQGGYRIFDQVSLDKKNYLFQINDKTFEIKRIISNQLRKAEKAALFTCTAGKGISDWSKRLMKEGDLMMGYVVDVVGSEVVEKAMDKVQDNLEKEMDLLGFGITDRFSPGYCDWMVVEQQKLFSFFPDNFCKITLSPSSLMDPIKSVSGIIGIGKDAKRRGYPCDFCSLKNCIYRRQRPKVS